MKCRILKINIIYKFSALLTAISCTALLGFFMMLPGVAYSQSEIHKDWVAYMECVKDVESGRILRFSNVYDFKLRAPNKNSNEQMDADQEAAKRITGFDSCSVFRSSSGRASFEKYLDNEIKRYSQSYYIKGVTRFNFFQD